MSNDKYQEILIVIIAGVFVFVAFIIVMVFAMLYNQKKKFQHAKEKKDLQENYNRQMLQARLEIQEATFERISMEIHDNVGQLLSLSKMQVSILQQQDVGDSGLLNDVKSNITQALTDLRNIAKNLNANHLKKISLSQALGEIIARINQQGNAQLLTCVLDVNGTERVFSDNHKIMLIRILQEVLQNALKHAQASKITIHLHYEPQALQISITDNGVGFDMQSIKSQGLGLQNIINRTKLIGGDALIDSVIDRGTTIKLEIPYEHY